MKNQSNHHHAHSGFTLLEMSIVLLIIAVLVAGVLVGRSLVVSSQLQTVMTDASNYISAVGNFKTAYQSLPGDYANAEAQWGTDSATCAVGGGATGTCNGNGDGKIGPTCNSSSMSLTWGNESFRAWQHLNAAGLVSSNLTGISASATNYVGAPGVNTPKSSMEGAGFHLMWLDDPSLCSNYWALTPGTGQYGNTLVLAGNNSSSLAIITSEQAESIDRKMDDGAPSTGKIRAPSLLANCLLNTGGIYTYNVTSSGRNCDLLFLTYY